MFLFKKSDKDNRNNKPVKILNSNGKYELVKNMMIAESTLINLSPEELKQYNVGSPLILADGVYATIKQCGNVLVCGSCGTGKSRSYVGPNLLQCPFGELNYVVFDFKSEMYHKYGNVFKDAGYDVQVFDTYHNHKQSTITYNPLRHIYSLNDVNIVAEALAGSHSGGEDVFFRQMRVNILTALIGYIKEMEPENKHTFAHMLELLHSWFSEPLSDDGTFDAFKRDMDTYKYRHPSGFGIVAYEQLCNCSDRTLFPCVADLLVVLQSSILKNETDGISVDNELRLEQFSTRKSVIFINICYCYDGGPSSLCGLLIHQICGYLSRAHKNNPSNHRYTHIIADEFASLNIAGIDKLLSTCRKYNTFFSIIVQSFSQLGEEKEAIIGNCDTILFLGTSGCADAEFVSKLTGSTVVNVYNLNLTSSRGQRDFMERFRSSYMLTPEDIRMLPRTDCILVRRGISPIIAKKYILESHPNYRKDM